MLLHHFYIQHNILASHKHYQSLKANFQFASGMPCVYYTEESWNLYFQAWREPEGIRGLGSPEQQPEAALGYTEGY